MYTRTTAIFLTVCLFVILSGAVYAQPGITNSGFESDVWNAEDPNGYRTTITGWTKTGGASWGLNQRGGPLAGTTGDTPEGGNFLFIQGSAANDVSQSLSGWQEGYRYDLTFHVNVREGAPGMNLEVLVGNKSIYGPVTHYYRQGWRQVVIPFRYQAAVMGGTDIKFRTSWTGADTTILIDRVRLTYARTVDFQAVMTNFESRLNVASYNTWGASIWSTIVDGTKGYAQLGPGFMWADHIANGIVDNVHLALLEPIVNDDPCARSLLGNTKMDDIQRAFMLNRNFVMTREFTFQVQLTNWSRATAVITNPVNCTLTNRPVWTNLATFTTGTQGHIDVSVDTGVFVVGTTTIGADFDLPSLWGPDSLLGSLSPGFDNDVADLIAAYLTIGDQNKVDYMQHIIASVMINGFRQNLDKFILDLLASGLKSDVGSGEPYVAEAGGEEKNYTPPALADQTFYVVPPDPKPTIEIEGTGTVTILQMGIYVPGAPFRNGVMNWVNSYNLGTTGLAPVVVGTATYGYPGLLRAGGDLDGDARTNLGSYTYAGGVISLFQQAEDVAIAQQFLWYQQPTASSPLDYGSSVQFNVMAYFDGGGVSYQWYRGTEPDNLAPVSGVTTSNWFFDTDFYSFEGNTRDRFYQVAATTLKCGLPETIYSNVVQIVGANPPALTVTGATGGGDFLPGAPILLSVSASCAAGQNFTYQWQKDISGTWTSIAGATGSTLNLGGADDADAGSYRCIVYNRVDSPQESNPTYYVVSGTATVNVAPAIVITQQPVGATLAVGDNYTLSVSATVSSGTLSYKWQRNTGAGWVDLNAFGASTTWALTNVQLSDAAAYRVVVRNVHALGTYTLDSAVANIIVGTGVVRYVDPTSPSEDGLTWATAFHTLQAGINAVNALGGGEVWVAAATYGEDRTENWGGVTGSLVMKDNVALYGGFEGYRSGTGMQETLRYQRRVTVNNTIIEGSTARGGAAAYHTVVFGRSAASTVNALLDGFIIQGGNAAGTSGVYHTWRGGGIYVYQSSPTISNCRIMNNVAAVSGGGMANEPGTVSGSNPRIVNCLFRTNTANRAEDDYSGPVNPPWSGAAPSPIRGGGAVFNNANGTYTANPALNFVTMHSNTVGNPSYTAYGALSAGMYSFATNVSLSNSIVWNNTAGANVYGSIVDDRVGGGTTATSVTYSDIQTAGYSAYATFNPPDAPNDLGPGTLYGDAYLETWNLRLTSTTGQTGSWSFQPSIPLQSFTAGWNQYIGGGDGADGMSFVYQAGANSIFGETGVAAAAGLVVSFLTYEGTVGSPNYDLIRVSYNGSTISQAAIDAVSPAVGLRTASWVPVSVTVTAAGGITVSWNGVQHINTAIPGWSADGAWYMGLGGRTGGLWDIHAASQFTVSSTLGTLPAGTGNISADPLLSGNMPSVGSPAVDAANPASTITEDLRGAVRPVNGGTALRSDMGAYEINAVALDAVCVDTTVDITVRTTIADPSEVFNSALSVVEAGLWYLSLQPYTFGPSDVGHVVPLTLTVYDKLGNSDTCVTNVTVVGSSCSPPLVTTCAPNPGPLSLGASCNVALPDLTGSVVYTDDCGDAVVTQSPVAGTLISADTLVTLTVTNSSGSAQCQVTVTVADTTAPVITRLGTSPVAVECGATYTDAGATAADNCGGDLTASIVTVNPVNTAVPGAYTVTYNVSDPSANAATQVTRTVNVTDTTPPVITRLGTSPVSVACGSAYTDAGATAADTCAGNLTSSIVTVNPVNTAVPGTYTVTYNVSDPSSNAATEVTRTVNVTDTTAPVITRLGTNPVSVECGSAYTDAGATAADTCAGNLTSSIVTVNPVNTAVKGTYTVTYNVSDPSSNAAVEVTRTVNVVDTTPPVITRLGTSPVTVNLGGPYTDAGATALDSCDGDLTASIVTVNPVNVNVVGTYTVTYNVSDSASNAAVEVTRTVNVTDTTAPYVASVTVTGATTVDVEFSKAMGAGVTTASNYTISGAGRGTLNANPDSVALVSGNIYRLTWSCPGVMLNGGDVTITVNDAVQDSFGNAMADPKSGTDTGGGMATLPVISLVEPGPACETYLIPDAILTQTNYGTNPVTYVQDDPAAPDANNILRANVAGNAVLTLSFANPTGGCTLTGTQTFRVAIAKTNNNAAAITIDLLENGTLRQTLVNAQTYTTAGNYLLSPTWSSALITNPNDVQIRITTTRPNNNNLINIRAVRWDSNFTSTGTPAANPMTVACGVAATAPTGVAVDQCGAAVTPVTITDYDGLNFANPTPGGTYNVVYSATDAAGNVGTVTLVVNVTDTAAPVITLLGTSPVAVACGAAYTDAGATAADACEGDLTASIVVTNPVNTAVPGAYTVRYNVSDSASNAAAEVTRTVNVTDTVAPVITLLGTSPVVVECGAAYTDAGATAADACTGDLTAFIVVTNPVNTAVPGAYTVRYNVSDSSANAAAEVTRTVNVIDTTPPVITLLGTTPVTVACGSAYTDAGATAADSCQGDLTASIVVVSTVNTSVAGTYTVTYNVSDSSANAAVEVTRTVNVIDTTPPVITLLGTSPVTVECGATYADAGATAADTCAGNLTASIVVTNPVNTAVPGVYTVRYNVSDPSANAATEVTRTVNVTDTTPPVITRLGTSPVTVECGATYTDAGATAADTCSGDLTASIVVTNPVNTAVKGAYTVRYNVSDPASNAATEVTRTVNVTDTTAPVITRLGNATVDVECGTAYTDAGATAADTCDGDLTASIVTVNPVNTAVPGTYTITYNVIDSSLNAAVQRTRTVNVIDTTAPVITRLGSASVDVECGAAYTDAGATAADTCGGNLTASIVTVNSVNTAAAGSYTVTYNVSDAASNAATQVTRTVNVVDTTPPVITRNGSGTAVVECGTAYTDAGATAFDVCGGNLTASIVTVNPVNTAVVGTYTVTYNVSDAAANAAVQVTRSVLVEDTTAPVITLNGPALVVLNLGDSYTELGATAADTCDGDLTASVVQGGDTVDTNTVGTYQITFSVSDSEGNAALTVTRTVNVVDTTNPFVQSVNVLSGTEVEVVFNKKMGTGADVAANYTISGLGRGTLAANPVSAVPVGATPTDTFLLTWTGCVAGELMRNGADVTITVNAAVQDEFGNVMAAPFSRTDIGGGIAALPVITLNGTSPVSVECATTYTDAGATAVDACGTSLTVTPTSTVNTAVVGAYTVTYNATDAAGNAAVAVVRTVNVVDTTVPVITLNGTSPVSVQCGGTYTDAGATAADACQGTLTSSIVTVNPVNTAVLGSYTVTYNVSDASSNAAVEVTRTVNVIDTTAPVITRLGSASVTVECGTSYTDAGATATDSCAGNLTASIVTVNPVNVNVKGTYTVTYNVSDPSANAAAQVTRTVNVEDLTAPVITLNGTSPVTVECGAAYTDAGATAADSCQGNLTGSIVVTNPVNTAVVGTYTVRYNVSDSSSNAAVEVTRTVNVADTTAPVITLNGSPSVTVNQFDVYTDAGATAADTCQGNLTSSIVVVNPVNTSVLGVYTVTYNVSDSAANAAVEVTRTVTVIDASQPSVASVQVIDGHTVRVTFTKDMGAGALVASNYTASGAGRGTLSANPANVAGSGAVYDLTWNCPQLMKNGDNLTITVNASLQDSNGGTIVAPLSGTGVGMAALPTVVLTPSTNPVTVECGVVYALPNQVWTDSCGTVLTANAPDLGGLSLLNPAVSSYTVTFSAYDAAGNLGTSNLTVNVVDTTAPVITLLGANPQTISLGSPYVELGATATDTCGGNLTGSIVIDASAVNTAAVGSYTVTYNVSDGASNAATQVTRTVNVVDTVQPFVTAVAVEDGHHVLVTYNKAMGAGVTAASNYTVSGSGAGTLASNPDSVSLVGGNTYRLAWSCPSLMANGGDITVTVAGTVQDSSGNAMLAGGESGTDAGGAVAALPVITLLGANPVDVALNDVYTDAGATAADGCSTDLTGSIVVVNPVNTAVAGTYTVTYNVADAAGNAAAEVARTVNVIAGAALAVAPIADIEIAEGGSGSLTAVASGGTGTYTYLWYKWDSVGSVFVALSNGGGYSGVDTATLTLSPFDSATMAGLYQVEVNDGVDTVTATAAVAVQAVGVPAAGGLGLAALALAVALGGARVVRRRK